VRKILIGLALVIGLAFPLVSAVGAQATSVFGDACSSNPNSPVCKQVDTTGGKANKFILDLINTLLFLLGTIAIIAIIVGGIRYTTSDGDSSKVKQGKDTVLYAVIGLIVALLAYTIVNFVIARFK